MVFFSHTRTIAFSIFAALFAIVEIILLIARLTNTLPEVANFGFELASLILLPTVVFGELIILTLEINKVAISHYPASIVLQDLGDYYGMVGRTSTTGSFRPEEELLTILVKRNGKFGKHYLRKIVFESRPQYIVDWKEDGDVPMLVEQITRKEEKGFAKVTIPIEDTEFRENQTAYRFQIRRCDRAEGTNSFPEVYFKVELYYDYKLIVKSLSAVDEIKIESRLLKTG